MKLIDLHDAVDTGSNAASGRLDAVGRLTGGAALGVDLLASRQRLSKPEVTTQRRRGVLGPVYAALLEFGHQPVDDLVESARDDVGRDVEAVGRACAYPAGELVQPYVRCCDVGAKASRFL